MPAEAFSISKHRLRTGRCNFCKACMKRRYKAWRHTPEGEAWTENSQRKRRFRQRGVTEEWYEQQLAKQGGVCAICKQPERLEARDYLGIDHCHETDRVRGLLCTRCNAGIGLLGDNVEVLANAIKYLTETAEITLTLEKTS